MAKAKRVAVIGAGPAGAITVDCLAQEKSFDVIRVFERREKAGGCWVQDPSDVVPRPLDIAALANRTADKSHAIPVDLPTYAAKSNQDRFDETSVYPLLETNIDASVMQFSQEHIPRVQSALSIKRHGPDTPFRHHKVIQQYVEGLLDRNGYQDFVEYNTTVEHAEKLHNPEGWRLTLRKAGPARSYDYWWTEDFDAIIVASGHYTVPFVPDIEGLIEFAKAYPDSVEHSKSYRGSTKYKGKKVVVVGASVSGMDIAVDLIGVAQSPVHAVVRGRWHPYFGGKAFDHPEILKHPAIRLIDSLNGQRTVYFEDGTSVEGVDHIILGTGYSWTLPFLPNLPIRNNRIPDLYQHIFYRHDPTLLFVGAIAAGFTFKVYEWQAVLAARYLAGRVRLPSVAEQEKWETDRIAYKGDGVPFTALAPDFEDYFETVTAMAGEPTPSQPGRKLPPYDKKWKDVFNAGHRRRVLMWETANEEARRRLNSKRIGMARL